MNKKLVMKGLNLRKSSQNIVHEQKIGDERLTPMEVVTKILFLNKKLVMKGLNLRKSSQKYCF